MNEWVLAVREKDQGEVVLGCQDGGGVVEDAVGVASLFAAPKYILLFHVLSAVSCFKKSYSAQTFSPF